MYRNRIYLCLAHMSGEEQKFIKEAFDTNWVVPLGPNVNGFEAELKEFVGCENEVVALSAGTAAVHLALLACGVGHGDEVCVQSFTFCASSHPITYLGATPVFIDSEKDTWNMDPQLLEEAIKDRIIKTGKAPKAIVPVALYGMPYKIDEIMEIANRYGIPVIEDAAEGFGSRFDGKVLGTFGKYGVLSFNGNKMITTSGGGMLLSADEEITKKALFLATQARDQARYYQHSELGYNYRMSNVVAGIGRGQLLHLEEHKALKKAIYQQYKVALADIDEITMNPLNPDGDANNWLSCITLKEGSRITPNDIMDALDAENIETRPIWKPMHLQPIYADAEFFMADGQQLNTAKVKGDNGEDWDRSVSGDIFRRGLCLPSDIKNTEEDMERIIKIVRSCFE